jgi:replicative DNA helicase
LSDDKLRRKKLRNTNFVKTDLEVEFLSGVFKSETILENIYTKFDSKYLSGEKAKWIYDVGVDLYTTEDALLDTKALKNLSTMPKSKRKLYLTYWNKIKKASKNASLASTITSMENLKELYNGRIIQLSLKGIIGSLAKAEGGEFKELAKARNEITSLGSELEMADVGTTVTSPMDEFDSWLKGYEHKQKNPDSFKGIFTGIRDIDRDMQGIRNSELGLILGESGDGKSILLLNFAIWCWIYYGSVAVVTIEMSEEEYRERFYCALSGIDYERFRKLLLNKDEKAHLKKVMKKAKRNKNRFEIIDVPEGCSSNLISGKIKKLRKKYNFVMVCVDYLNIMSTNDNRASYEWTVQVEIATELKRMARSLKLPVWSAIQKTDEGKVAFGKHIKDQIDIGLTMETDENTDDTGMMNFGFFKTRNFKPHTWQAETFREKMRFIQFTYVKRHKAKPITKQRKIKT